jgi:hypothetical protein
VIEGHLEEECWACCGYGYLLNGVRERLTCPWCRGTGVLYDGAHEKGESCMCHLGRDYHHGDDWFELTGFEIGGLVRARLPRNKIVADRIVEQLARENEEK